MGVYRFKFKEISYGFIDVEADNIDEAMELAAEADGDIFINDRELEIGENIDI